MYYLAAFLLNAIDVVATSYLNDLSIDSESAKMLLRGFIAAAIWVPYFQKSERVAKTFVERY